MFYDRVDVAERDVTAGRVVQAVDGALCGEDTPRVDAVREESACDRIRRVGMSSCPSFCVVPGVLTRCVGVYESYLCTGRLVHPAKFLE